MGDAALTRTEAEVLELVLEGMSNQEIADRRVIGIKTVESHVSKLLQKLECRDRAQLIATVMASRLREATEAGAGQEGLAPRLPRPEARPCDGPTQLNSPADGREWLALAPLDIEEAQAWNRVALALPLDAARQERWDEVERVVSAVRAVEGGAVVLWGESGNGKSWLARAVAEELARRSGIHGALIRVGANSTNPGSVYASDLLSVLTLSRQDARTWSTTGLEAGMRSLLQSPSCPFSVLVLDDATDADVERIVPATSTVPVIVTTRTPIAGQASVRIDPFTADEASSYLMTTLPQVTKEDAANLSRMLGHRPLALAAVQGVVNAHLLELAPLIESIAEDVAGVIESVERFASSAGVRSLRSIYAVIAELIDAEASDGLVLDALTWTLGGGPIRRNDLMLQLYGIAQPTATDEVALATALHRLDRMGVITLRDDVIEMNALTRSILRAIRVQQSTSALERLQRNLLDSQVPVKREEVMKSHALLRREEYRAFRDAMTEVLGDHRELGFLCIDRSTWFLTCSEGVWGEEGTFLSGCYLIEISPTGIRIVEAGARSLATVDQASAIKALAHAYSELVTTLVYAELVPTETFSLAIEPPDGLRHITVGFGRVESAIAERRPVWTVCGRRFVPSTQRPDLPSCFACDALVDDPAWTTETATRIGKLLFLLRQFTKPNVLLHAQLEATYAWIERRRGEMERAEAFGASAVALLTEMEPRSAIPHDVVAEIVATMPAAQSLAMRCLDTFGDQLLNEITGQPAWSHQWVGALSRHGHSEAAERIVAKFPTFAYGDWLDRSNFSSDGELHWALAEYNRERSRFETAEGDYWLGQGRTELAKAAFARACFVSSASGNPALRRALLDLYAAVFPDGASLAFRCSFCGGMRDSENPLGNGLRIICAECLHKPWSEGIGVSGICTFCQSDCPLMRPVGFDAQICEQCFEMMQLWAQLEIRPRSQAIVRRQRSGYSTTLLAEQAKRQREFGMDFAARLYHEDQHRFALRILELIAHVASDDPVANANLGFGLVPFDTARSQFHLQRALILGFSRPEIAVLNMGLSFARSGMLDLARSLLRRVGAFDESAERVPILWDPGTILGTRPEPRVLRGTDVRTVANQALRVLRLEETEGH